MTRDKILQEIASTHSLVRWRIENLGLAKVDFARVNLEKATFVRCRLDHASFAGANLNGAQFENCRLRDNNFEGADVKGARFQRCSGFEAETVAKLEQAGAVVAEPRSSFSWPVAIVVAVVVVAAIVVAAREQFPALKPATPSPTPAAPPPMTVEQLQTQIDEAVAASQWDQAIAAFAQLLTRKKDDVKLYVRYLKILLEQKHFKEASGVAQQALALHMPDDLQTQIRFLMAEALICGGDKESGLAIYHKLIEQAGDDVQTHRAALLSLGNALWKAGDSPGALQTFDELLKISDAETRPGVWLNIALVQRDTGNEEQETAALKKAAGDPHAPRQVRSDAHIHLGLIELRHSRIPQAVGMIEQAGREGADPGQIIDSLHLAAEALRQTGDFNGALQIYELAVRLTADSPQALNNAKVHLANLLMEMNRRDEALALYKEVAVQTTDAAQKKWAEETVREIESHPAAAPQ